MNGSRTVTKLLALLSALMFVLAACASDGGGSDTEAPDVGTDGTEAPDVGTDGTEPPDVGIEDTETGAGTEAGAEEAEDEAGAEDTETGDGTAAEGEPISLANVFEISGAGASFGAKWGQGVQLAVEQINENGGVLGRPLELEEYDTQSEATQSVTAVRRALSDVDPFVLFGSVFSSSTIVNMEIAQEAGVPQFTGSESPAITQQGNPNIFMTSYDSGTAFEKIAEYMETDLQADQVGVMFQNDEFGQGARDVIVPLLEEGGVEILVEITTEVGQTDFSGEAARILDAAPDAMVVVLSDTEAGRMHVGLDGTGVYEEVQMIGINPVVQSTALDLAGDAANGSQGIVDFSPAAEGLQEITDSYVERWGPGSPDHNFFKGYFAVYIMKIAVEEVGELDREAVVEFLHDNTLCASDHPELRGNSVYYSPEGRVDRDSFLIEVVDGQHEVLQTVGPLNPDKFTDCE